jgi:hypothetical protein
MPAVVSSDAQLGDDLPTRDCVDEPLVVALALLSVRGREAGDRAIELVAPASESFFLPGWSVQQCCRAQSRRDRAGYWRDYVAKRSVDPQQRSIPVLAAHGEAIVGEDAIVTHLSTQLAGRTAENATDTSRDDAITTTSTVNPALGPRL